MNEYILKIQNSYTMLVKRLLHYQSIGTHLIYYFNYGKNE